MRQKVLNWMLRLLTFNIYIYIHTEEEEGEGGGEEMLTLLHAYVHTYLAT